MVCFYVFLNLSMQSGIIGILENSLEKLVKISTKVSSSKFQWWIFMSWVQKSEDLKAVKSQAPNLDKTKYSTKQWFKFHWTKNSLQPFFHCFSSSLLKVTSFSTIADADLNIGMISSKLQGLVSEEAISIQKSLWPSRHDVVSTKVGGWWHQNSTRFYHWRPMAWFFW